MVFIKFRLISWVTKAFLNKHAKVILISSVLGILVFFLIYKLFPYLPQLKPKKRVAKIGRCEVDKLPDEILGYLSIGLTTLAQDGSTTPGLAKSWIISEDGLQYTFMLNDDIFWQDGTKVKAEQINLNFSEVEKEVIDEKTLKFKLKEPYAPFLTTVSKPVFKKNYLGVGPYALKRIKKQGNLVEKIILISDKEELSFRFYATNQSAILGFKLGEVDVLDGLLENSLNQDWQEKVNIENRIAKDQFLGLFFNTENGFLKDKNVRQALAYAIKDKPQGEERATGPISPLSWAYTEQVKLYQFNQKNAQELLIDSGKEKVKIATTQPFLGLAEKIKASWEEVLNLESEIEVVNTLSSDYQVFLGIQEIPSDPDQYLFWHSTRPENITHLKSPKIDKILEDARKTLNQEERKEKYFDLQKSLSEECPVVFLSHPQVFKITRKNILPF